MITIDHSVCPRHAEGFTLIELLVVLCILGLLASSIPSGLSASLPALRLRAATRILADDLRAARRAALLQEHEAIVRVMSDRYVSSNGDRPQLLPAGTRLTLADAPGGTGAAADRIRFFADGSSTGGRVELRLGRRHSAIAIDWLTGRISIDD
jgi:general secretion pathway protein H